MKELKKIAIALAGFCVCFLILDFGVGKFFGKSPLARMAVPI